MSLSCLFQSQLLFSSGFGPLRVSRASHKRITLPLTPHSALQSVYLVLLAVFISGKYATPPFHNNPLILHAPSITGINAGFAMFKASLSGIMHSAISFFDTTPMGMLLSVVFCLSNGSLGRVLSRLSKDQDTIDTEIAIIAFALLSIFRSAHEVLF
jgi:hypothetical protein